MKKNGKHIDLVNPNGYTVVSCFLTDFLTGGYMNKVSQVIRFVNSDFFKLVVMLVAVLCFDDFPPIR